jgi:hypothetical protein
MKKFLFSILGLLLIGGMAFGAVRDSAALEINLSVPAVYDVKISSSDAENVGEFNSATSVTETAIEYSKLSSDVFYMLVKTNDRNGFSVKAKLKNLKAPSPVTTQIVYDIKSELVTLGTSKAKGTTYVELLNVPASPGNGLRVVSRSFYIDLYSDPSGMSKNSAEAAAVGEYSATITFVLVTV